MPRLKFASWSVFASFVGGIGFGLLAFRQRYRSALAEVDRQRLEGDAESERLRLRLATVTQNSSDGRSELPPDPDDLKAIKGIGPVIEKALNDIGVCRYEQIAAFTPADLDRVSQALGSLARRIERDDWVGGARRIVETRAGEASQQR